MEQLERKLRFPPKMDGNKEMVTLPCSFVSRLLFIAQMARVYIPRDLERELLYVDQQATEIVKSGVKLTQG